MRYRALLAAAVAVAALTQVTACTEGYGVTQAGVLGVNAEAGAIRLLSVHVQAPQGHRYPPSANGTAWLTLVNEGAVVDRLTGVSSPDAGRVEIRWDRGCDGSAEVVPELPLAPRALGADAGTAPVAAAYDSYHLVLVGFTREVLAGTSVPLTFRFALAGTVDLAALVLPEDRRVVEPSTRCAPASGAASTAASPETTAEVAAGR